MMSDWQTPDCKTHIDMHRDTDGSNDNIWKAKLNSGKNMWTLMSNMNLSDAHFKFHCFSAIENHQIIETTKSGIF